MPPLLDSSLVTRVNYKHLLIREERNSTVNELKESARIYYQEPIRRRLTLDLRMFDQRGHWKYAGEWDPSITKRFSGGSSLQIRAYDRGSSHRISLVNSTGNEVPK